MARSGRSSWLDRMKCQSCDSDELEEFLDLGDQPICNRFLSTRTSLKEYPLAVAFCHKCHLAQLVRFPPSEEIWNEDYSYLTGTTPEASEYFDIAAYSLIRKLGLQQGDLVLDVGSNDGTFLSFMKTHGLNVLGVDSSPVAVKEAQTRGVPTLLKRLEDIDMGDLVKEYGKPKLVTAFNVLAHTDRPHEFLSKIRDLDTIFVTQSHYLPNMVKWTEYDTIYHEHLRYYTLDSIRTLLQGHDLGVQDMDEVEYYGGSFMITARPGKSANYFWKDYTEKPYREIEAYRRFAARVHRHARFLVELLTSLKMQKHRVIGAGAPMKCSTLLNFCGIGTDLLDYVVERNRKKVGTFVPKAQIPVLSYDTIRDKPPDYVLILAWNAARSIMQILRENYAYKGRFIVPIPEPRII